MRIQQLRFRNLVVGTKYDLFAKQESEIRKRVANVLRYYSHFSGSSLVFTTNQIQAQIQKTRNVLNTILFNKKINNENYQIDYTLPIIV